MGQGLLILNAGSSSLKFSVYALPHQAGAEPACSGGVSGLGQTARFEVVDAAGSPLHEGPLAGPPEHANALEAILAWRRRALPGLAPAAVGHRVVHGGLRFTDPVVVNERVLAELDRLARLAPLHEPYNITPMRVLRERHPGLLQVACFDTAFHRSQPWQARVYALPRALTEAGVVRYGFHGLSYDYIAGVLPAHAGARADGRVAVAHLGHGASLCAMHRRRSVATTMGFTPLDGLPMGTRCGALDPGVVLYLQRQRGMRLEEVETLLHHRCGLLGVSGVSGDMRTLLASDDPHAAEAVDLFAYRVARELGSLSAALEGLDVLVFTAGIGEHAPEVRRRICDYARWQGIALDPAANAGGGPRISTPDSPVQVLVIPTREEQVIARETARLLAAAQ